MSIKDFVELISELVNAFPDYTVNELIQQANDEFGVSLECVRSLVEQTVRSLR